MTVHDLKCEMPYFGLVANGHKTFEIQKNDRNFQDGDLLVLRNYCKNTGKYDGRYVVAKVTYVLRSDSDDLLRDFGLKEGYCTMSIKVLQ